MRLVKMPPQRPHEGETPEYTRALDPRMLAPLQDAAFMPHEEESPEPTLDPHTFASSQAATSAPHEGEPLEPTPAMDSRVPQRSEVHIEIHLRMSHHMSPTRTPSPSTHRLVTTVAAISRRTRRRCAPPNMALGDNIR